jgi:CubicO group peptidase (beta-lactamase class C family)
MAKDRGLRVRVLVAVVSVLGCQTQQPNPPLVGDPQAPPPGIAGTGVAGQALAGSGAVAGTDAAGAGALAGSSAAGSGGAAAGDAGILPETDSGTPQPEPAALPPLPPGLAPYWPTSGWQTATPDAANIDATGLRAAIDYASRSSTQGLLVIRFGYVVAEEYFGGFRATQTHESYSMAKSFSSALVGIAIGQGLLDGVEERVCAYYPSWDCNASADPRSRIEIRHLLTLSSGLSWMEDWSGGLGGTNDAIVMSSSPDPVAYVLNKRAAAEPGTTFQYSTGDPALLSGILQQATGMTALAYARQHLLGPIGIGDGLTWRTAASRTTTFAGMQATVRDYAKFGYLFLHRGAWDGAQIVPAQWVDVSTRTGESLEDWYGYLWHVNMPIKFEDTSLPEDGFTALGVFGQHIMVIPSKHLVVVRVAMDSLGATNWNAATFLGHLLGATR